MHSINKPAKVLWCIASKCIDDKESRKVYDLIEHMNPLSDTSR